MAIFGRAFPIHPWISKALSGVSASVNLTGVSATGVVGSFTPSVSVTLTGVSATAAVGSFVPSISFTLTGVSATAAVGSFTPSVSPALTSVSATGAVGSFTPSIAFTLSGVAATAQVGSFVQTVGPSLTGVSATGQVGGFTPSVAFTLQGVSATGQVGSFTFRGDVSIPLTGVSATGQVGNFAVQIAQSIALQGVFATGQVGQFTITIVKQRPQALQNIFASIVPGEPVTSTANLIIPKSPYGTLDLPSALFIRIQEETIALQPPIRLLITKPDTSIYTNNGLYAYEAVVQGIRYILYNTDTNELDEKGWWVVEWFAGPYTSSQSVFYLN